MTNWCYDELRRRTRRPTTPLEPVDNDDEEIESPRWLSDPNGTPEDETERAELAQALSQALARGRDPGGLWALRRYERARRGDNLAMLAAMDGFKRLFSNDSEPLAALRGWGVDIVSIRGTDCPPLLVNARGIAGGRTVLPEGRSSQYLSSLLLVAPYARQPASLVVDGEVLSKPYVKMTLSVMADFGVLADCTPDLKSFAIPQGVYRGREYRIEGDASNASYFWAAAAVAGGSTLQVSISAT